MINQREAKEATQQDYNDLVELMMLSTDDYWYGALFDSVVEILVYHREYDKDFADELDGINPNWNNEPNTHGVYNNGN